MSYVSLEIFATSQVKSKARILDKIKEYKNKPEKPHARYVCDFLRATIFAADPYALAVAFYYFQQKFKDDIVRVKNKCLGLAKVMHVYMCIHAYVNT